MTKCKDCGKEIEDKYEYCFRHSKKAWLTPKGRKYAKYRDRVLERWEELLKD